MEKTSLSHTQLTALLWAGVLAPAAELLPALVLPWAGRGSWFSALVAIPLVLLSGWLAGRLAEDRGLARGIRTALGPVVGKGILLLYIMWYVLLLALRLRLCAQRLQSLGQRDGALWFFLLGLAAIILWMGMGRPDAFARAGQLFLAVLLAAGGAVLLLSVSRVEVERILPLGRELRGSLMGALPVAGTLGWVFCGSFLLNNISTNTPGRWHWPLWGVGGCILLALAQGIILGNLGVTLASNLDAPFFALAKSIGVEGAFQRIESVIVALWVLADLVLGTLLLFGVRAAGREVCPDIKEEWTAAAGLLAALILAFVCFTGRSSIQWNRTWVPAGNLILSLILPVIIMVWKILCEKWHGRGHILWLPSGKKR